jgi:hypothetical protein
MPRITLVEVGVKCVAFSTDWKRPESQTLSMRTNIAAKKINVYQSILLIMPNLFGLNRTMGKADANAI